MFSRSAWRTLVAIGVVSLFPLMGLAIAGYSIALENRDEFCASCHTQPEMEFFQRAQDRSGGHPIDLAAAHAQTAHAPAVRCIDCHGGVDALERTKTLALAARDAALFFSGRFQQPAKLMGTLPNSTCLACHRAEVSRPGFENHFHNRLGMTGAPDLSCQSCHPAHTPADQETMFIVRRIIFPQCNACHRALGRGPSDLR